MQKKVLFEEFFDDIDIELSQPDFENDSLYKLELFLRLSFRERPAGEEFYISKYIDSLRYKTEMVSSFDVKFELLKIEYVVYEDRLIAG